MFDYSDAEVLKRYPDGKQLLYLCGQKGLDTVGRCHNNCLGDHYYWAGPEYFDPPLEYFFLVCNEDDTPGILVHSKLYEWFRKPHPTDGSEEQMRMVRYVRPGFLTSTSYDELYPAGEARGYSPGERKLHIKTQLRLHRDRYSESVEKYEAFKSDAIRRFGTLGKDHPLKGTIDVLNRDRSNALVDLQKIIRELRLFRGRLFTFRDRELILLSTTAKGVDYSASDERYGNKLHEFMGKDTVVSDPA